MREQVYEFIVSFTNEHGYPPTLREISDSVNRAVSVVRIHIQNLHDDGRIAVTPGIARGIRILDQDGE